MTQLTIGKLRGLQQLANQHGMLTLCAADHRDSLKKALGHGNPASVTYQDMVNFKLDLCQAVVPYASGVLLDPIYGAAQAITAGVLPGNVGMLVSIEETGYTGDKSRRITTLLPDWNAAKIKRMGASAVKLLIYFRPDLKDIAAHQLSLVRQLAQDCIKEDIPLLVEVVHYALDDQGETQLEFQKKKPQLVIESAAQITALPVDVLKTEFPAEIGLGYDDKTLLGFCNQLNEASRLPWILLSAGADYLSVEKEVQIASQAGASGFLAGRALWQESAPITDRSERMHFLQHTAAPRLQQIAGFVNSLGKPWYGKFGYTRGEFPTVGDDWYQKY